MTLKLSDDEMFEALLSVVDGMATKGVPIDNKVAEVFNRFREYRHHSGKRRRGKQREETRSV